MQTMLIQSHSTSNVSPVAFVGFDLSQERQTILRYKALYDATRAKEINMHSMMFHLSGDFYRDSIDDLGLTEDQAECFEMDGIVCLNDFSLEKLKNPVKVTYFNLVIANFGFYFQGNVRGTDAVIQSEMVRYAAIM